MSEYSVDVGLNLDSAGYVASMGQAINLTKQFSGVATGVGGAVVNMNKTLVGAAMSVTGFSKVSTVAVDTAAAYQVQLSKIEATSKLTGTNFDKLSKTTKGFARDFPVGMGTAVQVVQSLQSQGIKSEKQIESLGKSFIKLGAATGTSAAAIGTEFLQLTKTMGNGAAQFEKLSDSLVTTTAKIGGSVPSVVSFSKALAPVAATVGLSQTAVIGLSTAMSKMGEDGYQAANSFNKVLLDMNRAVRDGGPELKSYADMMGTTTDKLKSMFKTNPSEVLAQFSDAVAKAGPDITRQLDALGFDSVRTTRSLTALARSGGPRAAIQTAVDSYGNGATNLASQVALDGLTDKTALLQETMGQVVQDVGQPLLNFAKAALTPAQAVASGVQTVTGSDIGQKALGATGIAGAAAGMLGNLVTVATVAALGKLGFDAIKNSGPVRQYLSGRAEATYREMGPPTGGSGPRALGYTSKAAFAGGLNGVQGQLQGSTAGGLAGRLTRAAGMGMEGIARFQASTTNMMSPLPGGRWNMGVSPEMAQGRLDMRDSIRAARMAAAGGDMGGFRSAMGTLGRQALGYAGTTNNGFARGAGNMALQTAALGARSAVAVGGLAAQGIGAVGRGLNAAGLSGPMAGIIAAGAIATYTAGKVRDQDATRTRVFDARSDTYTRYNDFAEAIGKAGKGVSAFSVDIAKTTQTLVDSNKTWKDALSVSAAERSQATSPDYKPGITLYGDSRDASSIALQAQTTLGKSASMDDVSRVMIDVAHYAKGNQELIDSVGKQLAASYGDKKSMATPYDPKQAINALFENQTSNLNPVNLMNDAQGDIAISIANAAGREGSEAAKLYGGTIKYAANGVPNSGSIGAEEATRLVRARELFNAASQNIALNASGSRAAQTAIASTLNMSEAGMNESGLGIGIFDEARFGVNASGNSYTFDQFLAGNSDVQKGFKEKYAALDAANVKAGASGAINYGSDLMSTKNDQQVASEAYLKSVGNASGATADFGDAMTSLSKTLYGVENSALSAAKAPENLTQADVMKAEGNWSMTQFATDSGDLKKKQAAVDSVLDDVLKRTKGNFPQAQFALSTTAMEAGTGTAQRMVLDAALEQIGARQAVAQGGRPQMAQLNDQVTIGRQAAQAPVTSANVEMNTQLVLQAQVAQGQQQDAMANVNRAYGSMQLSQMQARRSAGISIGQITAGAARSESRAGEDFQLNRQYAEQDFGVTRRRATFDYNRQRTIANRDFNISQTRADKQYDVSKQRAQDDFNKQTLYSDHDYRRQRKNATDDYEKGKSRAQRDYDTSIARAARDFDLGEVRASEDFDRNQLRATEDYNKSRLRTVEDFNKQIARMIEDSAKSMYDPFKRIAAQMVMDAGQLLSNLADQTAAIDTQVGNLASARSMGLTDSTIKALGLSDAANAQQLARIVGDMGGNSAIAGQLNDQVALKASAAGTLATDAGNVGYARTVEDQATQMTRMDADFAQAQGRASEDFALSMSRNAADFVKQISDSGIDFQKSMADSEVDFGTSLVRMDADYAKSVIRSLDAFTVSMSRMSEDYALARSQSIIDFEQQMTDMAQANATAMTRMEEDFDKQQDRQLAALKKMIKRLREDTAIAIAAIGTSIANSVTSMEESFYGMFSNSATGIAAAEEFLTTIEKSNIPISDMSDDMQAMYAAAKAMTELPVSKSLKEMERNYGAGQAGAPEQASPARHATSGVMVPVVPVWDFTQIDVLDPDWAPIGKAISDGVIKGMKNSFPGDLSQVFKVGWEIVKNFLGIKSPSTLFKEVGVNIALGLKEGILDKIGEAWSTITDTVPTPAQVQAAVTGAFKTTGEWLGNLGTKIGTWIGNGWNSMWSAVEGFDIGAKVETAFATVKTYLGTLGTNITAWIATGWDQIWSSLPTPEEGVAAITKVFEGKNGDGGIKGWITKLPTWVTTAFSAVREGIANAFKIGFAEPIIRVVDWVIEKFNGLQIPAIDISFDIQVPVNPLTFLSPFGDKSTRPQRIELIKTTAVPLPNIGFGKEGGENLSSQLPDKWFADGGIVTRQTAAMIGEAGYPEAVIPLNQRGATVLAETMARYVGNSEVRGSRMESYATPVSNYYSSSQDYSTQFNGPITVRAQNPDEMAQRLAARARRQRLAQPIGGTR